MTDGIPGLPPSLKAGLELSLAGRDDENPDVCLGRPADHVRDEPGVTRGIQDGEPLLVGLERRPATLHCFTLGDNNIGNNRLTQQVDTVHNILMDSLHGNF